MRSQELMMTTCSSHRLPEIILKSSLSCIHVISVTSPLCRGILLPPCCSFAPLPSPAFQPCPPSMGTLHNPTPSLLLKAWVTFTFHFHLQRPVLPSNAAQTHSLCEAFLSCVKSVCGMLHLGGAYVTSLVAIRTKF